MKKTLIIFVGLSLFFFSSSSIAHDPVFEESSSDSRSMDIVLKVDGIDGESLIQDHEGEIDVLAWSWGATQSVSMVGGGGAGAGKVNVEDLSLTKYVDKASIDLLRTCFSGAHLREATLTVRKAGMGMDALDYMVITMSPVLVTSVSPGGNGGDDRLTENVTLNFAKVTVSYTPQKDDGSGDAAIDFTWSIEKNIEE
jgi:type VI secretion system secreted protein Hcp